MATSCQSKYASSYCCITIHHDSFTITKCNFILWVYEFINYHLLSWNVIVDVIFYFLVISTFSGSIEIECWNDVGWLHIGCWYSRVLSIVMCQFSVIQIAWNTLFWVHHLFMHLVLCRICPETLENANVGGRCSFKFQIIFSCQYSFMSILVSF